MSISEGTLGELRSKGVEVRRIDKEYYEIFIGPQHPGSGHMRFRVKLDGDIIVDADPDIGYVHRTMEKLSEGREWLKITPLVERMTIIDACNITLPYINALEKLMDKRPSTRASYLRVLLCEMNRIASHLYGFGIFGVFIGHSTAYMWGFGDREVFVELSEILTGTRLTYTYHIPGGVRRDMPQDFPQMVRRAVRYMRSRMPEYEKIFLNNPVIVTRLKDVGVITKNRAAELGVVGPTLRGSGIRYDVRLAEPYEVYGEIDFEVPVFEDGDALARTWVRVEEIKQSLNIMEQAIDWLERHRDEPVIPKEDYDKLPKLHKEVYEKSGRVKLLPAQISMKVPPGKAVARGEAGRGEIFYYVESDGGTMPYRLRVVTPSARNAIVFKRILPGHRLMDLPTVYGSIDYFAPEADR
ncbi:MAG: NADH-quinone oxidoreductase subunit D [Acidilobaceae archaeon]|nr:NADH-quinone oxidoreductase subunit D [Acidilobaceae archaeon]MCX8165789.1 NADH-quinone oxidoreductase subunit D [Acidilobaceae archaeon]MDW7974214.1 NADH-quinone oxidoreductase subunit D [Sulfolobales archaeon]